ncbi:PDZ domain (Also known as DHR or GLGF) domain-containing protein [Phthorimaea operculella]|nr:PDZ domain (Also known as DHR or GLGF) domain-containing protein [Phthorimaea operculella]
MHRVKASANTGCRREPSIILVVNAPAKQRIVLSICKGPEWKPGIFVQFVREGGIAREAGLRPGDQILSCNGQDFANVSFNEAISAMKVCGRLELVVREGAGIELVSPESSGYNSSASSAAGERSPAPPSQLIPLAPPAALRRRLASVAEEAADRADSSASSAAGERSAAPPSQLIPLAPSAALRRRLASVAEEAADRADSWGEDSSSSITADPLAPPAALRRRLASVAEEAADRADSSASSAAGERSPAPPSQLIPLAPPAALRRRLASVAEEAADRADSWERSPAPPSQLIPLAPPAALRRRLASVAEEAADRADSWGEESGASVTADSPGASCGVEKTARQPGERSPAPPSQLIPLAPPAALRRRLASVAEEAADRADSSASSAAGERSPAPPLQLIPLAPPAALRRRLASVAEEAADRVDRLTINRLKRRTWDSLDFDWKTGDIHNFDAPSDIEPDYDCPSIPNNPHTYESKSTKTANNKKDFVTAPSNRTIINLTEDGATIQCSYDNQSPRKFQGNNNRDSDKKTIVVEVHHTSNTACGKTQVHHSSSATCGKTQCSFPPPPSQEPTDTTSLSSTNTLSNAIAEEIQRRKMNKKNSNPETPSNNVNPTKKPNILKTIDNEKTKQHNALMDEFKKVHRKMFANQEKTEEENKNGQDDTDSLVSD